MKEIAIQALHYSDCVEVPTSLWVESRIVFAKQCVLEKDISLAVRILLEICYITPPMDIEGLSYKQVTVYNKTSSNL